VPLVTYSLYAKSSQICAYMYLEWHLCLLGIHVVQYEIVSNIGYFINHPIGNEYLILRMIKYKCWSYSDTQQHRHITHACKYKRSINV